MKRIILLLVLFFHASWAYSQDVIEQTFYLINQNRKSHGLKELTWNDKLADAAKEHADWMARVGRMTHLQGGLPKSFAELQNSTNHPVNRIIKSGYYPLEKIYEIKRNGTNINVQTIENINDYWGEIIACGKSNHDKSYPYRADICVQGWMRSPGHKAQILKPSVKEMGIAISARGSSEVYWCVNFGFRD